MAPALTSKQRKALDSIPGVRRINAREIEVFIADADDPGVADRDKTDAALARVREAGIDWGGFRTGYGAWELSRGHVSDTGDFNATNEGHHHDTP